MRAHLKKLHLGSTEHIGIQFYRYIIVGGTSFVIDFGILFLLTHYFGVHYLLSATISFIVGSAFNYILSVRWIFKARTVTNRMLEFWLFVGIGGGGLALNLLVIYLITHFFGIYYLLSKVIAAGCVFGWNFFIRRVVLFS